MHSPEGLLQDYLDALARANLESANRIAASRCLLEIPFLQPSRLLGPAEIDKAHRAIFAQLDSLAFEVRHVEADATHAIAEIRLDFTHREDGAHSLPAGIVVESDGEQLTRISLYCDSRNIRRWSDRSIQ